MLKVDLHVHSGATRHAMPSTIFELACFASLKGVKAIAITDHGPAQEGDSPPKSYFDALDRLPKNLQSFFDFVGPEGNPAVFNFLYLCRVLPDVRIFSGCEANVINASGEIDLPEKIQRKLNLVMAGFHKRTGWSEGSTEAENSRALINAMKRNRIHVISHPYQSIFPINIEDVCRAASDYHVALEVNLTTLARCKDGDKVFTNTLKMIEEAERFGMVISISTDAHSPHELGDDRILKQLGWEIPSKSVLGSTGGVQEVEGFLESK